MSITVKVAVIPGAVTEFMLEDNATAGQALSIAGLSVEQGYSLKVNGAPATKSTTLSNGALVVLAKEAKSAA